MHHHMAITSSISEKERVIVGAEKERVRVGAEKERVRVGAEKERVRVGAAMNGHVGTTCDDYGNVHGGHCYSETHLEVVRLLETSQETYLL